MLTERYSDGRFADVTGDRIDFLSQNVILRRLKSYFYDGNSKYH